MTFLSTDKMKLSVLVVAFLLLVSAFTFLPAVGAFTPTTVANAATSPTSVTGATATIDYTVMAGTNLAVIRTITINNPIGNPSITSITISVPKAAESTTPGTTPCPTSGALTNGATYAQPCGGYGTNSGVPGTPTVATFGSGPWAIVYTAATSSVLVPGGATINLQVGLTTEVSTVTSGVADHYQLSVSVTDTSGANTNLSPVSFWETAATSVSITGPTGTLTAGTPFTFTASASDTGLQLQVSASGTVSDNSSGFSATTTISPSTFVTGSSAQTITVNDTTEESLTLTVNGGTLASSSNAGTISGNTGSLTINAGPVTSVAVSILYGGTLFTSTGANTVINLTNTQGKNPLYGNALGSGNTTDNQITVSTADKYGNPAPFGSATTVTVSAITLAGQAAGFSTTASAYSATYPYTPSGGVNPSLTVTIGATATSQVLTTSTYYFFGIDYGSQSYLIASANSLSSGKSAMIATYTLDASAVTLMSSTLSPTAGSTVTINVTIPATGVQQANVPVNFANTTDTTGFFSNGLTSINTTTTVTSGREVAAVTFTPSTTAGDQVTITAMDALPDSTSTFAYNTAAVTPITLTTQGGTISSIVILTALSKFNAGSGTAQSTAVTTTGSLYVAVVTADSYGNPSATSANTQIALSTTGGLSATLLEIANGYSDTVNSTLSSGFTTGLSESIFTPTTGSSFVITAKATVNGVQLTGTSSIRVVSATPLLSVSGPTTLTTGVPSTITGTANASAGVANNQIKTIQYSVNGGSPVSVGFTPAANVSFSFTVLLTKSSSINVTVTDAASNANWQIVQVPPLVLTQTFTVPTGQTPAQYQFPNGGPLAVNSTFTNNAATNVTIIVVANIFTSGGLPVTPSPTATATVTPGATVSTFELLNGLQHGTYTVDITVYSTQYVTLSSTYSVTVTV